VPKGVKVQVLSSPPTLNAMFERSFNRFKRKRGSFGAMLESSKAGPDEDAREHVLMQAASRLMIEKFIEDITARGANSDQVEA
jgi:hypothetical protein